MSDTNSALPFEGEPVVEALGMDGAASDPGAGPAATGGEAIDIGQDTGIDDAAPARQDSAAGEANGLP